LFSLYKIVRKVNALIRHSRESGKCEAFIEAIEKNSDRDNLLYHFHTVIYYAQVDDNVRADAQSLLAAGKKLGMTCEWSCFAHGS
jgi:hypothetical protein